jgi:hypothetical protein
MKIGHRFQILLSADASKIALLSVTIVSRLPALHPYHAYIRYFRAFRDGGLTENLGKKLKRRLEDLERRAGSSSASPPEVHAQLKQPAKKQTNNYKAPATLSSSTASRPKLSPRVLSRNQYTPPMHNDEDPLFSTDFDKDGSHTPPLFAYQHSYPPPEESIYPPYPTTQSYRPTTALHPTTTGFSDYLIPAPMSLPSMMHFNEALKRDSLTGDDDSLNPFSMSYAAMAGIDIQAPQTYGDSNPHVSSLRLDW